MSWYEKKILYLTCYVRGEKGQSAGFAEFCRRKNELVLKFQLREIPKEFLGETEVWFLTGTESVRAGILNLRQERETAEKTFAIKDDKLLTGKAEISEEELTGVLISHGGQWKITGYLRQKPFGQGQLRQSEIPVQVKEHSGQSAACCAADKWEELQQRYPVIHPFGDDRSFIRIELKDFVIFHSSCQKLVNNSFLLHGFYNYRYLILGPDRELGGDGRNCYYLGVPGTYFEREKMVAVMFGFEGFECEGAVQAGKFGYYMRRVEL